MKRISTEKVELPTCSICLESFGTNEPNKPYFLLCGHSYHLHCIKKISEMSKSNEIICPLCRSPTPGTASSLKLNFSLLDLLEVFQKEKQEQEQDEITPCDECGFVASLFCVSCEVPYCVEHDKIAHNTVKAMASHNRIPILKKNLHVVKKCKLHNERLKIFCITCQLSICSLCRDYGLHKTHRTDLVPYITQHSQSELSGSLKKPEKSVQSLDKTLQVLAQRLRQGLSQSIPQGLSQSIPQGLSQTIPQGLSQSIPQGLSQSVPQGLSQSIPQGLSQTIPQGLSQSIPQGLSQSTPQGLSQSTPQGLSQSIPQGLSQSIPQGLSQSIPQRLSQSIPQGLSQRLIQAHIQAHQAVAQAQAQAQARLHLQSIPSQPGALGMDIIPKFTLIWEGIYSFKNDPQKDSLQVLAFKPHLTKKDFGIDEFPSILVLELAHISERLLLEYIPMYPLMQIKSPSLKQRLHECATVRLKTRFLVIFKHKDSVIAITLPLAYLPTLPLTPVKLELPQPPQGTLPKLTENQILPGQQQGWMGTQEGGMGPQQGGLLSTRSGYTLQQGLVQSVAMTDQHPGTVGISMGSDLPVSMGLNMGVSLSQNQSSISSLPSFFSVSPNSIIMNNNPKS